MKNAVKHLEAYLLASGWMCDVETDHTGETLWHWEFPEGDIESYTMRDALALQLGRDMMATDY